MKVKLHLVEQFYTFPFTVNSTESCENATQCTSLKNHKNLKRTIVVNVNSWFLQLLGIAMLQVFDLLAFFFLFMFGILLRSVFI